MTKGATLAIIGGEEPPKHMRGEMVEADFVENTVTLKMQPGYYAQHGTFVLVPYEDYEAMLGIDGRNK